MSQRVHRTKSVQLTEKAINSLAPGQKRSDGIDLPGGGRLIVRAKSSSRIGTVREFFFRYWSDDAAERARYSIRLAGCEDREAVADLRMVRRECQCLSEQSFCLVELALLAAHGCEVHDRGQAGVPDAALEQGAKGFLSFGELLSHGLDNSQVDVGSEVVGIKFECFLVERLGFVKPPALPQDFSEVIVDAG